MKKVFLVHGWTYSLDKWQPLVMALKARGFEPVLLHVPGLTEPSDEVWDIPKYVEWLHAQVKDEKELYLLGQSNGGRISMAFDTLYPDMIKHLFLVSAAGVYDRRPITVLKRAIAKPVASVLKPIARGKLRRILYRLIGARDYGNAKPNMRQTMKNVTHFDKTFDFSKVTAKTTLIWGKEDTATPLGNAFTLQKGLANVAELVVFDGVGHSSQFEKFEEVAEIIKNTLNQKD